MIKNYMTAYCIVLTNTFIVNLINLYNILELYELKLKLMLKDKSFQSFYPKTDFMPKRGRSKVINDSLG